MSGIITRFAGFTALAPDVGYSGDQGLATSAKLFRPSGITFDSSGNLYISDTDNNLIRKVNSSGIITTIAGTPQVYGYSGDGGLATSAELANPVQIAIDSGNLYIADTSNHVIRKIDPSGIITTIAGTPGQYGYSGDGESATSAKLLYPYGTAFDSGNLYIVDSGNHVIRKVNSSGIITTIAGTPGTSGYSGDGESATSAKLAFPRSIAFDSGNLYIADSTNNVIRKVNSSGIITTIAGTGQSGYSEDGGLATSAQLAYPYAIAFDSGNLYIVEGDNSVIRKVNSLGIITTIAGTPGASGYSGDGGLAINAKISHTYGIAFNSGNLYIADTDNSLIRKINSSGIITRFAGLTSMQPEYGYSGDGGLATLAKLNNPCSITFGSGNIYIADNNNDVIRKVNSSGIITTIAGTGSYGYSGDGESATTAQLDNPRAIAFDSGNLYIVDSGNHVIRKVNSSGIITTIAGTPGVSGYSGDGGPATLAELSFPEDIAFDSGNLYILDYENNNIRKVNSSGIITTIAGTGESGYSGDGGPATLAELSYPEGIAFDSGNLYIADSENYVIRKVDPSGIITTIAGTGESGYSGDGGLATLAELDYPEGIAFDSGNLYIADTDNDVIRKVDPSGIITTIAGTETRGYSGDGGLATSAKLNDPVSVIVYSGNLYIVDENNDMIRKVTLSSNINPPCFLQGTKILCQVDYVDTYIPVEKLVPGTLVKTLLNGYKKVVLIGSGLIENPDNYDRIEQRLYKLSPSKYPELKEDLFITGCHSRLVRELTDKQTEDTINHVNRVFVTDNQYRLMACIDEKADPWNSKGEYTIWHFALEHENVKMNYGVYANGLLVESCCLHTLKNKSNFTLIK